MNPIQALILGAVQGVAEFLPISSSGHLIVFKSILGLGEVPVLFDVLLHVSTLAAVCLVFRKRIAALCASLFRFCLRKADDSDKANMRAILALAVATACTVAIGWFVNMIDLEDKPRIVAGLFIVTAAILCASIPFKGTKSLGQIGWKEGAIVGLAQGIGVFPGISRSGITISASLMAGVKREDAGDFSFILSIPAILGAAILKAKDAPDLASSVDVLPLCIALSVAFAVGIVSLLALRRLLKRGALAWFAVYLVPAGLAGIFLLG
jgi:undecaprenyl-diphosphatase